jgi:arylsulfatase A
MNRIPCLCRNHTFSQREVLQQQSSALVALGVLAFCTLLCAQESGHVCGQATAVAAGRPNIVVILADDLGYGDLGCYGATHVDTPNLDRLASEGRRFTDAHSVSAVCTPSRYALLTGEYAWRKNIWSPIFHTAGALLGAEQMTVGRLLQQRGYATACVGKWHLGFGEKMPNWNGDLKPGPLEVGFDDYFGIPVVNSHPPFVFVENHRVVGFDPADPFVFGAAAKGRIYTQPFPEKKNIDAVGGARRAHELYRDEQVGTTLTEKAVAWLKRERDRPFFLYFSPGNIHHPFTPHPRFQGTSRCGLYGDFIHELDWMVGEVLRAVEELDARENTLVIFTSDNGGMLNGGGRAAWAAGHRLNGDLLGFKFGAWEGGHRVPFIARWPGRIPAGSRSSQLIAHSDLLRTLASIVEVKLSAGAGRDSLDLLPVLTGEPEKAVRDSVVLAPHQRANLALRAGPWVYIGAQGSGGFGNGLGEIAFTGQINSDVDGQGKVRPYAPQEQLYHLDDDPQQQRNVIREHPEVAAQMKAQLDALRAQAPAPAKPAKSKVRGKAKAK